MILLSIFFLNLHQLLTNSDSWLLGNVNRDFFETLNVFDSIENRNENVDSGF